MKDCHNEIMLYRMENRISLQSSTLNAVKMIMILFVIFIHMNPTKERYGEIAMYWHSIAVVAVPVFFIISGYFFFYNVKEFNNDVYVEKLKKRVLTLLIPYLLWNLLPVFMIVGGNLFSVFFKGKSFDALYSFFYDLWNEGIWHIWWDKTSGTMPFDSPLWYVRDLMIVVCLSPVIYWFIKRTGVLFPVVIGCLYVFDFWPNITGFSSTAFLFFSIGATYALKNRLLIDMSRISKFVLLASALVLFVLQNIESILSVNKLFIIISSLLWIVGSSHLPEKLIDTVARRVSSVFFIYAIHNTFVLANTSKVLLRFVDMKICYWVSPLITMFLCIVVYYILKKLFPRFTVFICGGRD